MRKNYIFNLVRKITPAVLLGMSLLAGLQVVLITLLLLLPLAVPLTSTIPVLPFLPPVMAIIQQ
jgi:hypothetical protein